MDRIYLDYAATAPVLPEVMEAMLPFFITNYGNPSGIHRNGREARKAIEEARRQTAEVLGVQNREIYFTSGGSESDNFAIKGIAFAGQDKGKNHLVTTMIEHPAVLNTCRWLEKRGFQVTYLKPDQTGIISPDAVREAIRPETILVSVMAANNEIGTIEPISEIGSVCREKGVVFHTDAVQAAGMIPLCAASLNADMISLSAHKFHGPKGIGALYIRNGLHLDPLIHGGEQERRARAGTENVPGIVGLGKAILVAEKERDTKSVWIRELRDRMITSVLDAIPDTTVNGHLKQRLPNNCHFSFRGVESEALLLRLDLAGIAASGGSACTSGSVEPSHVLKAIDLDKDMIKGSVRFTLGRETTKAEIDRAVQVLAKIVMDLRNMRSL